MFWRRVIEVHSDLEAQINMLGLLTSITLKHLMQVTVIPRATITHNALIPTWLWTVYAWLWQPFSKRFYTWSASVIPKWNKKHWPNINMACQPSTLLIIKLVCPYLSHVLVCYKETSWSYIHKLWKFLSSAGFFLSHRCFSKDASLKKGCVKDYMLRTLVSAL